MGHNDTQERKAIIGNVHSNFWLYDSVTGFDLTHPPTPISPPIENAIRMNTSRAAITIDPAKSALIIIDMQNFFLSPALGLPKDSKGLQAQQRLLQHAIPAARKAGMRIVWLNWGLTHAEIDSMPPATLRAFGMETVEAAKFDTFVEKRLKQRTSPEPMSDDPEIIVQTLGKSSRRYVGMGNDMGSVTLADGSVVDAGRMLLRDQWNTALTPGLQQAYVEGQKCNPPDVWIHKNRMSGLWGTSTACTEFLDREGIRTLFFAGVNTDQCVGGSLTDAFSRGYDCVLLSDGSATTSPESCQEAYEYNAAGTFGFCTTCSDVWEGVQAQRS